MSRNVALAKITLIDLQCLPRKIMHFVLIVLKLKKKKAKVIRPRIRSSWKRKMIDCALG